MAFQKGIRQFFWLPLGTTTFLSTVTMAEEQTLERIKGGETQVNNLSLNLESSFIVPLSDYVLSHNVKKCSFSYES